MKDMSNGEMDADDVEQFSLRWNNFHNNLSCGFHELLEEEDLVDVTLACDGQYVQAHKIVLTVCSPYFKTLFKINPNKTHPIVILKDVNFSDLQSILQFMYKGEVNVKQDDLTNFLKTAEVLKIKGLTGDDTGPVFWRQHLQETSAPDKRQPLLSPPLKRKRTQAPLVPVATGSSTPQKRTSTPLPPAPESDVAETKVEPADYVIDSRGDEDINPDPLSSPPDLVPISTSRDDSTEKEALQSIASFLASSFADIAAGPSSHDTSVGPSNSSELTVSQDDSIKSRAQKKRERTLQSKTCPKCTKVFCKSSNMKIHLRDSHGTKPPILCSICDTPIKNLSSLRVHMNRKHHNSSTLITPTPNKPNPASKPKPNPSSAKPITRKEIIAPSTSVEVPSSKPSAIPSSLSLSELPNFVIIKCPISKDDTED